MFNSIKTAWDKVKAFFAYSWSILLARSEVLVGAVVVAVTQFDLSRILGGITTGLTWGQGMTIGGLLLIKGVISELGRRAGTVTLSDGQLIPADIAAKAEAIAVIKDGN